MNSNDYRKENERFSSYILAETRGTPADCKLLRTTESLEERKSWLVKVNVKVCESAEGK